MKKNMKKGSEIIKSILRITGLTLIIIVIAIGILYVRFGPETEVDPTFLMDPEGSFSQTPQVTTSGDTIVAAWTIPVVCTVNTAQVQEEGDSGWSVESANCSQQDTGVTCQADLTEEGLVDGVTYQLQVHHAQCANDKRYVSTVTTFSL